MYRRVLHAGVALVATGVLSVSVEASSAAAGSSSIHLHATSYTVAGTTALDAITCTGDGGDCVATGGNFPGEIVTVHDGKPRHAVRVDSTSSVNGVRCLGRGRCLALAVHHVGAPNPSDSPEVVVIHTGKVVNTRVVPHPGWSFNAIACPTSSRCYVVGSVDAPGPDANHTNGAVFTLNARGRVTAHRNLPGFAGVDNPQFANTNGEAFGIACESRTVCIVDGLAWSSDGSSVASYGVLDHLDRGSPRQVVRDKDVSGLSGVGCNGSYCLLVGWNYDAQLDDSLGGATLPEINTTPHMRQQRTDLSDFESLPDASCMRRAVCVAVGNGNYPKGAPPYRNVLLTGAHGRAAKMYQIGSNGFTAVACVSHYSCYAAGSASGTGVITKLTF